MADVTVPPQKRVLPARERRESAAKRHAYSPAPVSTPAKKQPPSTSAPQSQATLTVTSSESRVKRKYKKKSSLVAPPTPSNGSASPAPDELLPTRLLSSRPLPTSRNKQPSQLSLRDYQSIADSAIIAASLHRSRMMWLCDGIFQKYWVKPVKRKGVIDVPPDNPDQKSMQKMGNGTITIEPHKFDVTFYVVRDIVTPLSLPLPTHLPPVYRHPNQHSSKPPYTPSPQHAFPPNTPGTASSLATPSQPPPSALKQEATPAPPSASAAPPAPTNVSTPALPSRPPPPKSSADPVIQMLAARAASDPHLKDLMKVVATSKASPDQLKEFQKHIDEFNEVVRQHDIEREKLKQASPQPAATPKSAPPKAASPPASHPAMYTPKAAPPAPLMPPSHYSPYPPQPRPEPIIKHIVVEFLGEGSTPDRWLFPEHAVLDIRYNGLEMTVSFFVERKGSDIVASLGGSDEEKTVLQAKWKADTEYYQPVTMNVRANNHRTIETIARGAKTLPAVQEYMKKVMNEKTRAPDEYLVHQLPREKPNADFVDSAVDMESDREDNILKDSYGNWEKSNL